MVHRQDERLFAQLFEAAPDGELIVDLDGRVRLANSKAHQLLGCPPGTLTETPLDEMLPATFVAALRSRSDARLDELLIRRRDGTELPVEIASSAVTTGTEQLSYVMLRDVSERHEVQQKLRESEERFRLLVEGVQDYAICFLDPEGHVLTWNTGAERLEGYRASEIIGESLARLYLPTAASAGAPSAFLARAAEHGVASDEGVRVRKDGTRFWAYVVLTSLHDEAGKLRGFAKVTRDITEQKHGEQSMAILADSSRLLAESLDTEQILFTITRMAVPSFADGVLIHLKDPHGEPSLSLFHAGNSDLLAAIEELQGKRAFRVAAPSRRVMRTGRSELHAALTPAWLRDQEIDPEVAALIRRFGISSTIHVPIMLKGRPFAVLVFTTEGTRTYTERDLAFAEELARRASTAIHNAELFQAAKLERERAEEAAALRERLVAIVGHDLRNPLSSICMAAEMLSASDLAPADEQLVDRIQRSASRMSRMIEEILDFARIRSGQSFELQLEPTDLHEVCRSVVEELRLCTPDREITLRVEGPAEAVLDADRISQVLSNLIGNAVQHGSPGPITVTVGEVTAHVVSIEVHNTGPAIPKAAQASMFEAFHRETTAGDRRSSIGLGLFIASQIVRAHGGTITVRSPDRNGTAFTVYLPRRHPRREWSPAEPAPPPAAFSFR